MSRKRDPRREALQARIDMAEQRAARALSGFKAKFTRWTTLNDTLKRAHRALRDYDQEQEDARTAAANPDGEVQS